MKPDEASLPREEELDEATKLILAKETLSKIIITLADQGPLNQKEIAVRIGKSESLVSRSLRPIEEAGLIREWNPRFGIIETYLLGILGK